MISINQIDNEITTLEAETPTHTTMQKLCALYVVRDHMQAEVTEENRLASTIPNYGQSEFLQLVTGRSLKEVMIEIDDLVITLQTLNPRLYSSFMKRLI